MNDSHIQDIKRFLHAHLRQSIVLACNQCGVVSNLRMKHAHALAVHELVRELSSGLRLDDRTTFLVRAAALLHDIGRFPQITEHQTYADVKSSDHAHLGVKILQEKKVISHFGNDASEVIEAAVRHHNKLTLTPELSGQARTVAEVLRDADKIDIIRIAIEFHASEVKGLKTGWFTEMSFSPTCNRVAATALLAGRTVPIAELGTVYDEFLLYLSWVDTLHFSISVQHLANAGHLEYMIRALPERTLRACVAEYISKRIEARCL